MLSEQDVNIVIGRDRTLFLADLESQKSQLEAKLSGANVLVIGAAGSIGGATSKLLSQLNPGVLHLVDINENELADMVRKLRITGSLSDKTEFRTYVIDVNSLSFNQFCADGRTYEFVLNRSAMKHVRSESNVYSLARMIQTNVVATNQVIEELAKASEFKYFCVSTDKAANPVNLMGLSKLVMENYAFANTSGISVSSARFANVAFSNGSLLQSFERRLQENKPLVIPKGIKRFFVSEAEAGIICVLSGVLAPHRSILVPSKEADLKLISFETIVENYLKLKGYEPDFVTYTTNIPFVDPTMKQWPVLVSEVDTTGEKPYEEFVGKDDHVRTGDFRDLSLIAKDSNPPSVSFADFKDQLVGLINSTSQSKVDYVELLSDTGAAAEYVDVGKYLDDKI